MTRTRNAVSSTPVRFIDLRRSRTSHTCTRRARSMASKQPPPAPLAAAAPAPAATDARTVTRRIPRDAAVVMNILRSMVRYFTTVIRFARNVTV
jgi:hypothetical protein